MPHSAIELAGVGLLNVVGLTTVNDEDASPARPSISVVARQVPVADAVNGANGYACGEAVSIVYI